SPDLHTLSLPDALPIFNYLPFAALPVPLAASTAGPRPLIAKHEIVSLPSASTLSILRHELNGRASAAKTLAVVADPVFEPDDERSEEHTSELQSRSELV